MTILHMITGPAFWVTLICGAFFGSGFLLGWQIREDTLNTPERNSSPDEHTAPGS